MSAMAAASIVRLSDYKPFPFVVPNVALDVVVQERLVQVTCQMNLEPQLQTGASQPLVLRGVDLELIEIRLDEQSLSPSDYSCDADGLVVHHPPAQPFCLTTICRLDPFANASLEGLYASGGMLTTQCEAEGFRRITFHPDRPDVLSRYRVRIEAERERYPVLLSNGNLISAGPVDAQPSRHEAVWDDPFPKPSYLFALVAGDLREVRDRFTTASGRAVDLRLHVEPGDEPFTAHAMESLKRSMLWDEQVYGLEYDLEEFKHGCCAPLQHGLY